MAGAVMNNVLKSFTNTQGSSAIKQGGQNINDLVDKEFIGADNTVEVLVAQKDEIAKPQMHGALQGSINDLKTMHKRVFADLEEGTKTVEEFQYRTLTALGNGMYIGTLKTLLALIPETPDSKPPAQTSPYVERTDVEKMVNDTFDAEDVKVANLVSNTADFADPYKRKGMNRFVDARKKINKDILSRETDQTIPKDIDELRRALLHSLLDGMAVGNIKTALALIPEASKTN